MRLRCSLLAAALFLSACSPASTLSTGLTYLGQVDFPASYLFDDTTVGGLSAITYDPGRQLYYIISDDRSARNPARFYTVRITLSDNRLIGVEWLDTTSLLDRSGAPFPPLSPDAMPPVIPPDPEGIAFDERRQQLYWSSEGERIVKDPNRPLLLDPWVRVAGLDGAFRGQYDLPPVLWISQQDTGPRTNNGLEGLTLTPSGNYLFAGMEDPGFNDGGLPTAEAGALTRVTRFDVSTGTASAQYAYPLDPITAPNGDANGLSDLVALDDDNFLVIERSHGAHNVARIYRASTAGADDILDRPSLADAPPTAMTKILVADLSTIPQVQNLDNVEGITLGPRLSDGRQVVVLVTDDNFSDDQTTQFYAFAME
ncbi:phytase [Mycobacterium gallinarum]|uniref:Phytase n=1 Tax=Mycobacterium gallinarum TaxID=39689 RepID=A0A9W4B233_9MYCO|nr:MULTISPECIES: esterase-like activity of phytase family protein [Mycobacterium]MDV3135342.1 esterase-like activity of phytase family protein [Mycobacterium sp. 29Ha]BBY92520.1 phytase [Mycobacterium gallinarum]